MDDMNRTIMLGLITSVIGFGQIVHAQSGIIDNSIYSTLGTNISAVPFTSSVVHNAGQSNHEVFLQMVNNGAQVCSTSPTLEPVGSLQFSYDGTVWVDFGSKVIPSAFSGGVAPRLFIGSGVYPRVRFTLTAFDTLRCRVTLYYAGINSNPIPQIVGLYKQGTALGFEGTPIFVGGTGDGRNMMPLVACNMSATGSVTTGNIAVIVPHMPGITSYYTTSISRVCGIMVNVPAATSFTITQGSQTTTPCDTTTTTLMDSGTIVNGGFVNWGGGLGQLFAGAPGNDICLTAAGGTVSYTVSFARGN